MSLEKAQAIWDNAEPIEFVCHECGRPIDHEGLCAKCRRAERRFERAEEERDNRNP